MKDTLLRIQKLIQANISYIREGDIFLTGFTELPPDDVKLPAIGIKDGTATREEMAGQKLRLTLPVTIVIWTEVLNERQALTGNVNVKGILDIEEDLDRLLDENTLGSTEIRSAVSDPTRKETEPRTDGNRDIQRKELRYEYIKVTTRPSEARTGG